MPFLCLNSSNLLIMANIGTLNNKQVLSGSNFDSNNLSTDFKHQIFYKEIKAPVGAFKSAPNWETYKDIISGWTPQ